MALDNSLAGIRNRIVKSLFGSRLGFLKGPGPLGSTDQALDYLGGVAAVVNPLTTVTSASTASTIIPNYGVTIGRTTDSSGTTAGWCLDNPSPGVHKTLIMATSGYGVFLLNGTANTTGVTGIGLIPANANSSAVTQLTLPSRGCAVQLVGLSTSQWGILTPFTSVSTSQSSAI